jgi:hypothetical protein
MADFRAFKLRILVSTDVMARGVDLDRWVRPWRLRALEDGLVLQVQWDVTPNCHANLHAHTRP